MCNPNGQELYSLGLARDIEYSRELNELSSLSFQLPKYKDEDIMPYYHEIKSNKYVKVDGIGTYIVRRTNISKEGTNQEYKTVDGVYLK